MKFREEVLNVTLAQILQVQGDREGAKRLFAQAAEVKRKTEAEEARRLGTAGPATPALPNAKH